MAILSKKIEILSEEELKRLAKLLAGYCSGVECICLHGELGAGKTTFAGHFINALSLGGVEVTSPTFTLVQEYEGTLFNGHNLPLYHLDLYRMEHEGELVELGLEEMLARGITLIEWPSIASGYLPPDHLTVTITTGKTETARVVTLECSAASPWRELPLLAQGGNVERSQRKQEFLSRHGWDGAEILPVTGDASFRSYARLKRGRESAILMDAPPDKEPLESFIGVRELFERGNFAVPALIGADQENGFLLLSDFGDDSFTRLLRENRANEWDLYRPAIEVLVAINRASEWEGNYQLPPYDWTVIEREASLLGEWLLPFFMSKEQAAEENREFLARLKTVHDALELKPQVPVHRDFHADNLFWLAEGANPVTQVGLLDFQDALLGRPAYDLVSLLEDARRDVSPEVVAKSLEMFEQRLAIPKEKLAAEYAFFGAQRNAKILGIFARLWLRDGKPRYLDYIPRVWDHFAGDLKHPLLKPVQEWADKIFTTEVIAQLKQPESLRQRAA